MKRGREESYASSAIPCYVEIRVDRVERDKFFLVISCKNCSGKVFIRIEISFDKGISPIFLNLNLFEIKKMEEEEENVFLECIFDFYRSSY